jgi:hypothetical protein
LPMAYSKSICHLLLAICQYGFPRYCPAYYTASFKLQQLRVSPLLVGILRPNSIFL